MSLKLGVLKIRLKNISILVLTLLFLMGCSNKTIQYETVEVLVPVETITIIKQNHRCQVPEGYPLITYGDHVVAYYIMVNAFDICLESLE